MINRYDMINTSTLIRGIQRNALLLEDGDFRKKTAVTKLARIRTELNEMRRTCMVRLSQMNRLDPLFFPTDSHVLYHKAMPEKDLSDWSEVIRPPDKNGQVIGHEENLVLCKFEGEDFYVKVEPRDLKLKYIRP